MDRESRRNSILKPSFGQALFDGDEENNYTEVTQTFHRRKSLKRVSFAGRDQIKEFEKHEALVDKAQLSEVFNKLKDVSSDNAHMVLESEKENIAEKPQNSVVSFESLKTQVDDEDMELTTTLTAYKPIQVLMQQTVVNEVEMEVTSLYAPAELIEIESVASSPNVPLISLKVAEPPEELGITMNEVEMSLVQEETMHGLIFPVNSTLVSEEKMEISTCTPSEPTPIETFFPEQLPVSEPILPKPVSSAIVESPFPVEQEIKFEDVVPPATAKPHLFPHAKAAKTLGTEIVQEDVSVNMSVLQNKEDEIQQVNQLLEASKVNKKDGEKDSVDAKIPHKKVETGEQHQAKILMEPKKVVKKEVEEKPQIKDFMEDWTPELGWQASRNDNELLLTNLRNCLTLRLELKYEYLQQNVRHYVVEEVEVETKRGLKNKWARFGLNVLENTLESCALKSKCSTTQDLDKLLQMAQDYIVLFEEFMLFGSEQFEWMTDPRTLQIDIEQSTLSFEKSNLENLILIRITLKLSGVFPLSAADTRIECEIGTINKSELISMISAISPTGLYLLRVAECIDDYLKFPPTRNECGILDSTRS